MFYLYLFLDDLVLDLANDAKAAIAAVPGLAQDLAVARTDLNGVTATVISVIGDVANTAAQVTTQQGQINNLSQANQTQDQTISALTSSLGRTLLKFVDGACTEVITGVGNPPIVSLLTTIRAKLAIYQINHFLNFQAVKMVFQRVDQVGQEEFLLECQTGMQRLDANNAIVNVPLSGTYVLALSKH